MIDVGDKVTTDALALGFEAVKHIAHPQDAVAVAYALGFFNGLMMALADPVTARLILDWYGRLEPWRVHFNDQWIAEWKEIANGGKRP